MTFPQPVTLSVGLWNCRLAVNKADIIPAFSSQSKIVLASTETWITVDNTATPSAPLHRLHFHPTGQGGGTGLLISTTWKFSSDSFPCNYTFFEYHAIPVTNPAKLHLVVIYRPPGHLGNFHDILLPKQNQQHLRHPETIQNILLSSLSPPTSSSLTADDFASYFNDKLATINNQISTPLTHSQTPPTHIPLFTCFSPLTENEVSEILCASRPTTCPHPPTTGDLTNTVTHSHSHHQHIPHFWKTSHRFG